MIGNLDKILGTIRDGGYIQRATKPGSPVYLVAKSGDKTKIRTAVARSIIRRRVVVPVARKGRRSGQTSYVLPS